MSFLSISVCPGMDWDPAAEWARPAQGNDAAEEQVAAPEDPAQGQGRLSRLAGRRRARTDSGTFQADDPATPAVNEAYQEVAEPSAEAESEPGKLRQ